MKHYDYIGLGHFHLTLDWALKTDMLNKLVSIYL